MWPNCGHFPTRPRAISAVGLALELEFPHLLRNCVPRKMVILSTSSRVEVRGQSDLFYFFKFLFSISSDHIGPPNLGILIISLTFN